MLIQKNECDKKLFSKITRYMDGRCQIKHLCKALSMVYKEEEEERYFIYFRF